MTFWRRWWGSGRKQRFSATYPLSPIAYGGVTYQVRELSFGERTAFAEFARDNGSSPILIMAWLSCQACEQFRGDTPADIALHCSPGALSAISTKIIQLSGMDGEAIDDAEKKSPSSPS